MSPEKDKALRAKYPLVFQGPLNNDEPIRCGDGWEGILDTLFRVLNALIASEPEDKRHLYRAVCVKEKFGTLRVYQDASTDDMDREVYAAVWCSKLFCERCGKATWTGVTVVGGIFGVRCPEHATERNL